MSFDYDKLSEKHNDHGSWWTSYADLFMMLSIVFLLMYVASSLRQGSAGFQQQLENQKLTKKAQGLEEQIKVYNTLKDDTLKNQASESEQQVYKKLMGKLSLLQDEARDEKDALRKKAKENEEKEFALNQYQQLVRSIIDTNILAKSQIHHRDQMIVTKDATIEEKRQKIAEMEQVVAQNEQQINTINTRLEKQIEALKEEQEDHQITKSAMQKKIAALRQASESKVQVLEERNRGISKELGAVKGTLQQTEVALGQATATVAKVETEKSALVSELESEKAKYVGEMEALKQADEANRAAERQAFEDNMKRQRLSAAQQAQKLAQFADAAKAKANEAEARLNGLKGKIAETENRLAGAQNQLAGTQQKLAGTQQALQGAEAEKGRALAAVEGLKGDLEKTRAIANARKKLAQSISDQLAKNGIKGVVNPGTGEVTLDFGEEYFDTGSTLLKPRMETTLDKFIPVYAQSLFSDPKFADKIGSVEVVGFASSTFRGKYVNPRSVRQEDKEAIEYNLKLSFGRANSIFKHVLNQSQLSRADRDRLLPIIKVVGRGYLPEGLSPSEIPDGMSERDFCAKFNCKKAQKVIVKFNMKD